MSNKIRADEIKDVVDHASSLQEACDSLIQMANGRGGEDNITVLVTQVSGGRLQATSDAPDQRVTAQFTAELGQPKERWGVETIPRDEDLPFHIDHDLVDDEETTIPPEDQTEPIENR